MELLDGPQQGASDQGREKEAGSRQNQRRRKPGIPTVDDCLVAISQLAKLIALGLLSPAQANSMRATYQAILQHHDNQGAAPGRRGGDRAELQEALKAQPHLANHFAGVLSDEDIQEILASDEEEFRDEA